MAASEPLDALLQRTIFQPLAMRSTHFALPPAKAADDKLAAVFQPGPDGRLVDVSERNSRPGVATVHPLGYNCGGEGLISSCADFYRFAAALHNGGAPPAGMEGRRFLSPESARLMTANQLGPGGMAAFPSASASQQKLGFGTVVPVQ